MTLRKLRDEGGKGVDHNVTPTQTPLREREENKIADEADIALEGKKLSPHLSTSQ